jgi:CheY-like chemotaxis protein
MARLLIVDDEPQMRKLLSALLGRAGHEVHTASDALTAIEMCGSATPYDLVLTEVMLPLINGHELARWIAVNCPNCRVVLLTGEDVACDSCPYAIRCKVLPKPFLSRQIVTAIAEVLRGQPS